MLNLIRQYQSKLKWILWFVIVALAGGMVLLFVSTPGRQQVQNLDRSLAKICGKEVALGTFRSYMSGLFSRLPANMRDENTRRQYGTMVLQQMIQSAVMAQEARQLGFDVTDDEITQDILSDPEFNINGDFIGSQELLTFLNRQGTTIEEFEEDRRTQLLARKLAGFISNSAAVTEDEIRQNFLDTNNKAKIRFVQIPASKYNGTIGLTDADLQRYYQAHQDNYTIGETRVVKYVVLDTAKLAQELAQKATENEIQDEYSVNKEARYTDQVKASHILIKAANPEAFEAARVKAQSILDEVLRPGADFAALATKYSEDNSASNGGDVGFFPRNRMVPEFDQTAFSLKVGDISGLVKTQFGYHIIKVTDRHDLAYYRPTIARVIGQRKAEEQITSKIQEAAEQAKKDRNLEQAAKEMGGTVLTSKPFNLQHPELEMGSNRDMTTEIFKLKLQEVAGYYQTHRGYVIPQLVAINPPGVQKFEDVKRQVKEDCEKAGTLRLAGLEAQKVLDEALRVKDFEKAAKKFNLTVETSELFTFNDSITSSLGKAPLLAADVLRHVKDDFGGPAEGKDNMVVYQVLEREQPDLQQLVAKKDEIRQSLLSQKQNLILRSFVNQLLQRYQDEKKIEINAENLNRILG